MLPADRDPDRAGGAAPGSAPYEDQVSELLAELTLEEKAVLTGGRDVWHLPAVPRLGIGALKMSDGPSGVRGAYHGIRRSMAFPCGMAVGATWDLDLVHRYGQALAGESKAKGAHVLLGPTINIVRTPLAGRTFECFSEDPHLTSRLAVAYIRGVQGEGVACCVKHYACNDQEQDRFTVSADVDTRTLREVHLPGFEASVREAGVWSIMGAYNKVDGTYACEHPELLTSILRGEWGFDGVVISDWLATHSTVPAATAGLDIEMPGPPAFYGRKLAEAVARGELDETVLDGLVANILRLMARTGALPHPADGGTQDATAGSSGSSAASPRSPVDDVRLRPLRGEFHQRVQAGGDAGDGDVRRALGKGRDQPIPTAAIVQPAPAHVPVERAGGQVLGQRELLEGAGVKVGDLLGGDDLVDEGRRQRHPRQSQARSQTLTRGSGVNDPVRVERLECADRVPVVPELPVVVVFDDQSTGGSSPLHRYGPAVWRENGTGRELMSRREQRRRHR
jgi:beta-glucosidase-like glycosyl hydrolase